MKSLFQSLVLAVVFFLAAGARADVIGSDFRISVMGPDASAAYQVEATAVAHNSVDDEFLVVWTSDDDSGTLADDEYEVWGQLLDADGNAVGEGFRISNMGDDGDADYDASALDVVYNSADNQYLVAWRGDTNTGGLADNEYEVWGQLLDADGNAVGADFRISHMGDDGDADYDAYDLDIAYNDEDNAYLVVWQGDTDAGGLADDEYEIWGQLIEADGSFAADTDFRISAMGPDGQVLYQAFTPRAIYNATDDQYLVVWHGDDNTGSLVDEEFEIWGQRLAADGSEDGVDFRISAMGPADGNANHDGQNADVAYNGADNQYLVVWESDTLSGDLIDNEFEIWGQLIEADGSFAADTDFRISAMGDDGNASFDATDPRVVYNGTNSLYLVVWQGDTDAGDLVDDEFEIWSQLLTAAGEVQGDAVRVSDAGDDDGDAAYDAVTPQVAYDGADNRYLVVWAGDDDAGGLADGEFEAFGQLYTNVEACSVGQFSVTGDDGGDAGSCTPCSPGTYQAFTGQTECLPCIAGSFQEDTGQMVCIYCAPGTYQPETGQSECLACDAGSFQPDAGAIECFPCNYGSYQPETAQISCLSCEAGSAQDELGQIACDLCPAGKFSDVAGEAFCDECPVGSYTDEEGQTSCTDCAAGTYADDFGLSACLDCAVGTFSETGAELCSPCDAGSFAATEGSPSCELCAAGTYAESAAAACTECPDGFTSDTGASVCSESGDDSGDDDDEGSDDDDASAAASGCQLNASGQPSAAVWFCVLSGFVVGLCWRFCSKKFG